MDRFIFIWIFYSKFGPSPRDSRRQNLDLLIDLVLLFQHLSQDLQQKQRPPRKPPPPPRKKIAHQENVAIIIYGMVSVTVYAGHFGDMTVFYNAKHVDVKKINIGMMRNGLI